MQLEDGKGRGNVAEVNDDNQLVTNGVIVTHLHFNSEKNGISFSWSSGTYDAAAGDTILLIKNTSTTKDLHIHQIWLSTDTETRVVVHVPATEVTPAGTTITGSNLNTTSAIVAGASAKRDETDNTQGNIYWAGEIQAATNPLMIDFEGALILGQNESIGVDYVADVAACDVTILGHY